MSFKTGQWVKCIQQVAGLTKDRVYQITRIDPKYCFVKDDLGLNVGYYKSRFKLDEASNIRQTLERYE